MDDAEVKVKIGLHDTELRAGLAGLKEQFESGMQSIKHSIEPVHHAMRTLRLLAEGAGIFAVAGTFAEMFSKIHEYLEEPVEEAKKIDEHFDNTRKSIDDILRKIKQLKFDQSDLDTQKVEQTKNVELAEAKLKAANATYHNKLRELEEGNKREEELRKTLPRQAEGEHERNLEREKEALELLKNRLEKEADLQEQRKRLYEINHKIDERDQEVAKQKQRIQDELDRRLAESRQAAADYSEEIKQKTQDIIDARDKSIAGFKYAAENKFMPGESEVRKAGSFEARQLQREIDDEKTQFLRDRLSGLYAGNQEGAQIEANHIEEMQKQLANYLGGDYQTTNEKIASATKAAEILLGRIAKWGDDAP